MIDKEYLEGRMWEIFDTYEHDDLKSYTIGLMTEDQMEEFIRQHEESRDGS